MRDYKERSYSHIYSEKRVMRFSYWLKGSILAFIVFLFLPWTQNIQSNGLVTTRLQENRPQNIQTQIGGRIAQWKVKEGDFVRKGDTILVLTEVKDNYLDPKLVERTREQASAKRASIDYYKGKANATQYQIEAIERGRSLKIQQLKNYRIQLQSKLKAEQAELVAATNDYNLALDQRDRQRKMFQEGLVSQTQLQQREVSFQNALAKKTIVENKIAQTQQEIINNQVEQNSTEQEYMEKKQKAEGDRLSSLSDANTSLAEAAKLENQVSNYEVRSEQYIVKAPQDGQVVQVARSGIGEILKEGEVIGLVVPDRNSAYAVEVFVRPVDLPLIEKGQKVRMIFDGFPTIVFTGWPKGSYGTFGGEIVAFENTISDNGMFRVLVVEDKKDDPWPKQIKVGSGAKSIVLLKEVPIWYEVWRNINGFPPDYYKMNNKTPTKVEK
ncbi:MAG: HlyD family efflux transporter periplasmic adaptor subunit [Chitinophagales bacterium]|nr:HlyD family efflux transporter periplasmic adaptor subunit [Chitinophagales bacterium]